MSGPAPGNLEKSDRLEPGRTRRRFGVWVLAALIVVLAVVVARVIWQVQAEPTYWQDRRAYLQETPTLDMQGLAQQLEMEAPREWSRPIEPGEGSRTIELDLGMVNAWLATRLKSYLENQGQPWPNELGEVMIAGRDGEIVLAGEVMSGGQPKILSIMLTPGQTDDGQASLQITGVQLGRQSIPRSWLTDQLSNMLEEAGEADAELIDQIAAGEAVSPIVLPVDGHRAATVQSIDVSPTAIQLQVAVEYLDR
jgi:uncharacterized protein YpmS